MTHPPLLAVDLGENVPYPESVLSRCEGIARQYNLRGIIYFSADHFTARLITRNQMVWFHNGIFTGRSLVHEGSLPTFDLPLENAVAAIYIRSPATQENSDMPCEAAAR